MPDKQIYSLAWEKHVNGVKEHRAYICFSQRNIEPDQKKILTDEGYKQWSFFYSVESFGADIDKQMHTHLASLSTPL